MDPSIRNVDSIGRSGGSSLLLAAQNGDKRTLKQLLDAGKDNVNLKDGSGRTPLSWAAGNGHEEIVELLLGTGRIDVDLRDELFLTPLSWAVKNGHKEVVELLLDADNVNVISRLGRTYPDALSLASYEGRREMVQLLLDRGINVNARGGGSFKNALTAASAGGYKEVVQLLLDRGADINAHGGYYKDALHAASDRGREEVVDLLIGRGANINAQGGYHGNVLTAPSRRDHKEVAQPLFDRDTEAKAYVAAFGDGPQAGLSRGHNEVVQSSADRRSNINAQGLESLQASGHRLYESAPPKVQSFSEAVDSSFDTQSKYAATKYPLSGTLSRYIYDMEPDQRSKRPRLSDQAAEAFPESGVYEPPPAKSGAGAIDLAYQVLKQRSTDSITPFLVHSFGHAETSLSPFAVAYNSERFNTGSIIADRPFDSSEGPTSEADLFGPQIGDWRTEVFFKSYLGSSVIGLDSDENSNFDATYHPSVTTRSSAALADVLDVDSDVSNQLAKCFRLKGKIMKNIERLKAHRVESISTLFKLYDRPGVAALREFRLQTIEEILSEFEKFETEIGTEDNITTTSRLTHGFSKRPGSDASTRANLNANCEEFCKNILNLHHILPFLNLEDGIADADRTEQIFSTWLFVLSTMDIMIMVHVGILRKDFWLEMGWNFDSNVVMPHWPTHMSAADRLVLRPRPVSCLTQFLENDDVLVWEYENDYVDSLYSVRCSLKEFSNIWGNVWGVPAPRETEQQPCPCKYFKTRGGYILPWKSSTDEFPLNQFGERLCHWVPEITFLSWKYGNVSPAPLPGNSDGASDGTSEETCQDEDWSLFDENSQPLTIETTLLIGADSVPTMRYEVCDHPNERLRASLLGQCRMRRIRTTPPNSWFEFRELSLQAGWNGAGATAALQRERVPLQSVKQAMVDDWATDKNLRNPYDFEKRYGVIVSACTWNACRVRLKDLLRTNTILLFIDSFPWSSDDPKTGLIQAIFDTRVGSIKTLWDTHPDWKEETGEALLTCLRALSETGIRRNRRGQKDSGDFLILWKPSSTDDMYTVTIKASEHPWVRFLKDSEFSSAMAVLVTDAYRLPSNCQYGRRHHTRDEKPSILETALTLNPTQHEAGIVMVEASRGMLHPDWGTEDRDWPFLWSVERVEEGHQLRLLHGRIQIRRPEGPWCLIVSWDAPVSDYMRGVFGMSRSGRAVHWEYLTTERSRCRPVLIHVV